MPMDSSNQHAVSGGSSPNQGLRRQKSSGSVKRARQRAAAGLPLEEYRDTLQPRPLRITPNRTPPRATTPSGEFVQPLVPPVRLQKGPSPTTSIPGTPKSSNWPSSSEVSPVTSQRKNTTQERGASPKGPPPQRPPRPAYVPLLPSQSLDQQEGNYWETNFLVHPAGRTISSNGLNRPVPGTSFGSIPEFPVPFLPQNGSQSRRNLGPPPSARKGGANFYPQNAFVAPIPEEQSEAHSSFASSHVIPTSWGDGPPEYYMGSGIDEEDEDDIQTPSSSTNDGREPRAGDHDESTGLVRKVGTDKLRKPSLKTAKGDGLAEDHSRSGQEVKFGPGAGLRTSPTPSSNDNSPLHTPGPQTSDFPRDQPRSQFEKASPSSDVDPRVAKILGGLEKGGALSSSGGSTTPLTPSMSDRGGKRPARLNLDNTRDASEARGSATSLPDLIRRATKLASNLDRGRTASRIGMLEMLERERSKQHSRNGSLSDILAAFPSPSLGTPSGERAGSARFPSPFARSGLHNDYTAADDQSDYQRREKTGRRCCGIPIWALILLSIILMLLIAAAIVIPITLIVLPRQNPKGSGSLDSCRKSFPCANGGTSVLESGSCRCVCSNGFTGAECRITTDSGCTTGSFNATDNSTTYRNATVGTSIGRLLTAAEGNYSIPLDTTDLLSLFSFQNLTCTSENALVTFNGRPQRRRRRDLDKILLLPFPDLEFHAFDDHISLASPNLPARALISPSPSSTAENNAPTQAAVTSNGIVFAAPSGSPPSPSQSSSPENPKPSSSSTPNKPTTSTPQTLPLTPTILDFARTAILYILQERDLSTAVLAQDKIQEVFLPAANSDDGNGGGGGEEGNFNASVKDVGGGIVIDWGRMSVDLGKGRSSEGGGRVNF